MIASDCFMGYFETKLQKYVKTKIQKNATEVRKLY